MISIFAGPIYSDSEIQLIKLMLLILLVVSWLILTTLIYIGSKIKNKIKPSPTNKTMKLSQASIVGFVIVAVTATILYFAS